MKIKTLGSLILAASLAFSTVPAVMAEDEMATAFRTIGAGDPAITVIINESAVDFSRYDNVFPFIENDITLIPVRAIAEGLGFEVTWYGNPDSVGIQGPGGRVEILLTIDSAEAVVNGESVTLDVPARLVGDRTFVPLRFVSENLGANVTWDEASYTITIESMKGNGDRPGMGGGITAGAEGDRQPKVETDPDIAAVINEGAEKFAQFTFDDEETGISLEYSLYIPENYDENEVYPMIMYIPDASGASKSAKEIVEQYYGADIWATDEEQAKHESFVLVPAFSVVVVDDDWNTSEEIETGSKSN